MHRMLGYYCLWLFFFNLLQLTAFFHSTLSVSYSHRFPLANPLLFCLHPHHSHKWTPHRRPDRWASRSCRCRGLMFIQTFFIGLILKEFASKENFTVMLLKSSGVRLTELLITQVFFFCTLTPIVGVTSCQSWSTEDVCMSSDISNELLK